MISLFKDRSAVSVFWLVIICFALHVYALINPPQVHISPADGFFYYLLKPLQQTPSYFVSLLYVLIIFLLALQVNFILNYLRMFQKPSYTPALAFLLFSALLPVFNVINAALFATVLFTFILYSACKLYAAPNPKTSIYNFGLLTGLCIVLYYASAPLILIALIALAIIRPFRTNEWFVLFFGIITPAYFVVAYLFLTDELHLLPAPQQIFKFIKLPVLPLVTIITLAVAAFATLMGILSVQNSGANALIQVRKSWSVFLIALILILPIVFFITGAYPFVLMLAMVPAACFTGFAFANNRNILPVIFFWALMGLAIYNNWFAKH